MTEVSEGGVTGWSSGLPGFAGFVGFAGSLSQETAKRHTKANRANNNTFVFFINTPCSFDVSHISSITVWMKVSANSSGIVTPPPKSAPIERSGL